MEFYKIYKCGIINGRLKRSDTYNNYITENVKTTDEKVVNENNKQITICKTNFGVIFTPLKI